LILFVGNSDNKSLDTVKITHPDVVSIIDSNQLLILDKINVGYVSICDHDIKDFVSILSAAQEITYVTSDSWDNADAKTITETWVRFFSHIKKVNNIPSYTTTSKILHLEDQRASPSKQLWACGCSFTAGVGLNKNQRWGQLVADKLNLPVSFLARNGASNPWVADQILRSDIGRDDIVVWALTGIGRLTYFNNDAFEFLVLQDSSDKLITKKLMASSDYTFYLAKLALDQVIKKSKDVGFKLAIVLFPFFTYEQELELFEYLSQYNFLILGYEVGSHGFDFLDLASDNHHAGPKHNQYWAEKIYKSLDLITKK